MTTGEDKHFMRRLLEEGEDDKRAIIKLQNILWKLVRLMCKGTCKKRVTPWGTDAHRCPQMPTQGIVCVEGVARAMWKFKSECGVTGAWPTIIGFQESNVHLFLLGMC